MRFLDHGIPDPEAEATFGVPMSWTAVSAISSGNTQLVIDAARRFVTEG